MESEREVKFEVAEDFRLTALEQIADVEVRPAGEQVLKATYYDTAALDLARWGVTLRFRTTGPTSGGPPSDGASEAKWTLKLPDPAGAPEHLMSRTEVDFDAGPGSVPRDAEDLVGAYRRGRRLHPVCDLTTTRVKHLLLPSDSPDPAAEVDDDTVEFTTSKGRSGRFREIEVELKSERGAGLLPTVAQAIQDAGAQSDSGEPKVLRALEWKPPRFPPQSISKKSSVESLVSYAIAGSVRRLLSNDPMVRITEEPEAVHQARVATRRLRSDLSTLKPLLKAKTLHQLREDLKEAGARLGTLRDTDVMLERLRKSVSKLSPREREEAEVYVAHLVRERGDARSHVLDYLSSDAYVITVDHLVDAIDRPPVRTADLRAADVLPDLTARRWKALKRRMKQLGSKPADQDLHQVRIAAKRCRYAAELAAPVVGEQAALMAKTLADLQSVLGKLQDAVVLEQWIRSTSAHLTEYRDSVADELIRRERKQAAKARKTWHKPWDRISDKGLADWLG